MHNNHCACVLKPDYSRLPIASVLNALSWTTRDKPYCWISTAFVILAACPQSSHPPS